MISEKLSRHGMTEHPVYAVWRSMLARCQNKKHKAYHNYGGRGIQVCPRWKSFESFWEDMKAGYEPGLSIERLDNNKGYYKKNCAWVNRKAQGRNTRFNHIIETPKGRMTIAEASELSKIGKTTLLYRSNAQCPKERMFDPPDVSNRFTTF
jgi:hypothetical protein